MKQQIITLFNQTFGHAPTIIARAPGRVEVLGNHTDYNEGVVLSAAIDKEINVAVAPSPGSSWRFFSADFPAVVTLPKLVKQPNHSWVNYPLGVMKVFKDAGYEIKPCCIAVCGNVPQGAGLSSSAALEVATALAIIRLNNLKVDDITIAKLCQKAENTVVGANTGLLDQFSSLFGKQGHLLYIDFRTLKHSTIAIDNPDLCLAITPSMITHSLVASEYNSRRAECTEAAAWFAAKDPAVKALRDVTMAQLVAAKALLPDKVFRRALHIVGENDRVKSGLKLLKHHQLDEFGMLLFASHASSRTNFENSCPELDKLVAFAGDMEGVYGSRLSGGGFGGATLSFIHENAREDFCLDIVEDYYEATGIETTVHCAHVADGASVI